MSSSERNYSLDKAKIKFLLLEGLHPRAREIIESEGYTNIVEKPGALMKDLAEIPATIRTRILH
jgi:D-3-phosphoglycerate dehydrogenase